MSQLGAALDYVVRKGLFKKISLERIRPDFQNSHLIRDDKIIVSAYYLTESGILKMYTSTTQNNPAG